MPKIQMICRGCGINFMKYECQVDSVNMVFCTKLCRNQNYKKANPDWHHVNYRPPQENKHACTVCGIQFTTVGNDIKYLSRVVCGHTCKAVLNRTGKLHTEKTKGLISQKQSNHCAIHGNQFTTGKSAGQHTAETINILSVKNLGKEPQWKGRVFQYDGPKGCFKMRSSYELAYANYLDKEGVDWEYEPQYILSNGMGYAPDFRLGDGTIIEIKGFWTEKARAKWDLFCSDNVQLPKQVIMKQDLLNLGLEVT